MFFIEPIKNILATMCYKTHNNGESVWLSLFLSLLLLNIILKNIILLLCYGIVRTWAALRKVDQKYLESFKMWC